MWTIPELGVTTRLSLSPTLSPTHTHAHTHSVSVSLSLSLSHTHTHTHSLSLFLTLSQHSFSRFTLSSLFLLSWTIPEIAFVGLNADAARAQRVGGGGEVLSSGSGSGADDDGGTPALFDVVEVRDTT